LVKFWPIGWEFTSPDLIKRDRQRKLEMEATIEEPAIAFPAIAAPSNELTKYRQVNTEVSALEARFSRLELDEADALNDLTLDEG
jgi:hypothetical protein